MDGGAGGRPVKSLREIKKRRKSCMSEAIMIARNEGEDGNMPRSYNNSGGKENSSPESKHEKKEPANETKAQTVTRWPVIKDRSRARARNGSNCQMKR